MIPNLRQPTARLTDSAAVERLLELKSRGQIIAAPTGVVPSGPEFREFQAEWQRMMVRENA